MNIIMDVSVAIHFMYTAPVMKHHPKAPKVVIDTNIIVAAGFNKKSYSAQMINLIREKRLILVWNQTTLAETRAVIRQIPPLNWEEFASLFEPVNELKSHLSPGKFELISDQSDRKFAALAEYAHASLITNDEHLLSTRPYLNIDILTSKEACGKWNRFIELN
jgi:uncharacterized protein